MSRARRVLLYGGSFDPPHVGHVLATTWALCRLDVDEVRLVPVYRHAFDKALAPFDVRRRMVEAAIAHLRPLARVDPVEADLGDVSYTLRTVQALREREPKTEWLLMMGADAWQGRAGWHRWDELAALVEPVVIGRRGVPDPPDAEISVHLPDISSTEARERIREGRPAAHLVPEPALHIAYASGLYR